MGFSKAEIRALEAYCMPSTWGSAGEPRRKKACTKYRQVNKSESYWRSTHRLASALNDAHCTENNGSSHFSRMFTDGVYWNWRLVNHCRTTQWNLSLLRRQHLLLGSLGSRVYVDTYILNLMQTRIFHLSCKRYFWKNPPNIFTESLFS